MNNEGLTLNYAQDLNFSALLAVTGYKSPNSVLTEDWL
jgi:hypothetical protein